MDAVGYSNPMTHEAIPEGIVFLHIMDLLSTMPLSVDETFLLVSCQIVLTPVMAGHYSACGYIS